MDTLKYSKAYWLLRNTSLTYQQIADFCSIHVLEVAAMEEGTSKMGVAGYNPVESNELTKEEIERCQKDPTASLQPVIIIKIKKKTPANKKKK